MLEAILYLGYKFGYFGIFLASLIGSATILLPLPASLITFTFGSILNPLFVGIAAGVGSAIGELTGYFAGIAGGKIVQKKKNKDKALFEKIKKWFSEKPGFVLVILFSATPLIFDIMGIFCGIIRYDIKKFFVATLIGKLILNIAIAYAGFYGIGIISSWFF